MHYKAVRLCLQNWYLCQAQDIELRDATAFIGATGAGKTSLQDAIQLVLSGDNHNRVNLNSAAPVSSHRTVLSYCLGYLDSKADGAKPQRTECETVIAVVFKAEKPDGTPHYISVGVAMEARENDTRETIITRFIAHGVAYSVHDFRDKEDDAFQMQWRAIEAELRRRSEKYFTYPREGLRFVGDMLAAMRPNDKQPDPRQFLRTFQNAVAFRPITDPSAFVRDYILERDDLDVDRVRKAVANWKELTAATDRIIERLSRLRAIKRRFDDWARLAISAKNRQWEYVCATVEVFRTKFKVASAEYLDISKRADAEASALAKQREIAASLKDDLQRERNAATGGMEAQLDGLKSELQLRQKELQDVERGASSIREYLQLASNLVSVRAYLPASMLAASQAAEAILKGQMSKPGGKWLEKDADAVARAVETARTLGNLKERLQPQIDAVIEDLSSNRKRRDDVTANLVRVKQGGSQLSAHTQDFKRLLATEGIDSTPLCDVVEVVEKDWQQAAEMLLGRNREALIVDPASLSKAFGILYANRNTGLGLCRLVKTTRTNQQELKVDDRSIARALRSDNRHAWAFIVSNIGSFFKAETEAELERMSRAVMRSGKATASMAYSVNRNVPLILGREAAAASVDALTSDARQLEAAISSLEAKRKDLDAAVFVSRQLADRKLPSIEDLAFEYDEATRRISSVHERQRIALSKVDAEAQQRIADLEKDIAAREKEITETEATFNGLTLKKGAAGNLHSERRKELKASVISKRRFIVEVETDQNLRELAAMSADVATATFLPPVNPHLGTRLQLKAGKEGVLRRLQARMREIEDAARSSDEQTTRVERGARSALDDYVIEQQAKTGVGPEDHSWRLYGWTSRQINILENNELLRYQEEARMAEKEMIFAIKEDLLTKLKSKFDKLDVQLRTLRSHMRKHRFLGKQYAFYKSPNPEMTKIRQLALKVGEDPEAAQAIIEGNTDDPALKEAMKELEEFLAASGTSGLEDYRKYFSYELYMGNDDNDGEDDETSIDFDHARMRKRNMVSLSGKIRTASGGEGQSPFYVAIAVSMALTYYPGSPPGREQSGFGLVLFDEAFSKPDIPLTQAIIEFYKDLGLQLIIAAPEDKRPTFTEVMDTIVSIAKTVTSDGDEAIGSVYIASEHPKEYLRQEMAKINPDHVGIDGFREIAAQRDTADAAQ
jgi:hypothetical protein